MDIQFILQCKRKGNIPKFARPKISLQETNPRLVKKIGLLILKSELKNKYKTQRILKQKIKEAHEELMQGTTYLFVCALQYKVRIALAIKKAKWLRTHQKKIDALSRNPVGTRSPPSPTTGVVHNFSGYDLSEEEQRILSFSLDHYIPGKDRGMKSKAEFERFYQSILNSTNHLNHLPERERMNLKTKFLDTYRKYSGIRLNSDHEAILKNLYSNKDIVILRQDKGRGVVIMDRTKYVEKAAEFLEGPEFTKLEEDPTKTFQTRVQNTLRGIKKCFDKKTYESIYPSSARPGLFYGLAKVHKIADLLGEDGNPIDSPSASTALPLRPVISNIGTATYELSRHLAKLLKPLTKSGFALESSKEFVELLRSRTLPPGFKLVSFDVVSLFTKVPLDYTIEVILRKIYDEHLITTKIPRGKMKKLLLICTKEVHFLFNGQTYQQIDGVAMGSPLGPVIANIFMSELEQAVIPTLAEDVSLWRRYVDDTFTFIREGSIQKVLDALNGFHPSIQFTHEEGQDGQIAFLDVKVITKQDRSFNTEVYRKKTDTNVYIHWQSFAPKTWKIGTLRGLIRRAFVLCSTEDARKKEIAFLKKTFRGINGYPSRIVNTTIREVEQKFEQERTTQTPLAVQHVAVQSGDNPVVVDAHQIGASANSSVNATVVANDGTLLEHPASTPVVVGAHQGGAAVNPTVNATVSSNTDALLEHPASSSAQNESKDF